MADSEDKPEAEAAEKIIVHLEAPGATGHRWSLDPDETRVRVISRDVRASTSKMGAPATEVFILEPLEKGEFDVKFILSRPWEQKAEVSRIVRVKSE